ncbi:hypothetical protein [Amycolatopsis sp. MJM2582]|uniref:hypothetical protein n=1 Tax=Amycolatopsis sp. MJM2582 TaxID=1427749 RepID=UPI001269B9DD|nr:hypothetical protein [Amycolatopsis sp. MJM2582]
MAGQCFAIEAARIRRRHSIPTISPDARATLLAIGLCRACRRRGTQYSTAHAPSACGCGTAPRPNLAFTAWHDGVA